MYNFIRVIIFITVCLLTINTCFAQSISLSKSSTYKMILGHSKSSTNSMTAFVGRSFVGEAKSSNKIIVSNSYKHFLFGNNSITSADLEFGLPVKFSLHQNYPNPFNPSTVIKYSIPEEGFVNLKIFNLLGEKIAELANEVKSAGTYEVTWNAHNLANGIYVYTIRCNNYSDSKKLMLLK